MSLRVALGIVAGAALAIVLLFAHDRVRPHQPFVNPEGDFTAFYCAGLATRQGYDPYLVEPLRACEHQHLGAATRPAWFVVPTPFPGYVLALYAVVSLLPYTAAHWLWLFVLFLAVGVTIWALREMTRAPVWAIAAATIPLLALYDLTFSEPTPLTAAAFALAGLCVMRRNDRGTAVSVAAMAIEPHFALPAFIAVLLFLPGARRPLAIATVILGALSLVTIGLAHNIEYFVEVLPQQALSEVRFSGQYSLTHLLSLAGASDSIALLGGNVSYLVMVVVGIWGGKRVADATGKPEFIVLLPPVIAMIGGTFVHDVQIIVGICAAVAVASLRSVPRTLAVLPVLGLSVIWTSALSWPLLAAAMLVGLGGAAVIALHPIAMSRAARVAAVAAIVVAGGCILAGLQRVPDITLSAVPAHGIVLSTDPTEDASRVYSRGMHVIPDFADPSPRTEFGKIPTWIGLLALLVLPFRIGQTAGARASSAPGITGVTT